MRNPKIEGEAAINSLPGNATSLQQISATLKSQASPQQKQQVLNTLK